jgi:hypothetical protein
MPDPSSLVPDRDTGMLHLRIVGNANFCISDNPVSSIHLIGLETSGIRPFPAERKHSGNFLLADKMNHAMYGGEKPLFIYKASLALQFLI